MTKKKLAILEKCFAAEIDAAINNRISPLCQLRDSKIVRELAEEGMIEASEQTLGGKLPVRIKGYVLTHRGHFAYCDSCRLLVG